MSTDAHHSARQYTLGDDVRVFDDGGSELRLRIGIWNYDEAVLDLSQETTTFRECLRHLFRRLAAGEVVGAEDLQAYSLDPYLVDTALQLLETLRASGFVTSPGERESSHRVVRALLGNLQLKGSKSDAGPWVAPGGRPFSKLLFLTDSPYCRRQAESLGADLALAIEPAGDDVLSRLRAVDLTSRMDGLAYSDELRAECELFAPYSGVIAVFRHLSVAPFRNLNRVLEHLEMWATVAFIDGPFITLLGVEPPLTGCLECFELRSLARLQDHISYHRFAKVSSDSGDDLGARPLLNVLTNLALCEGFLLARVGTSKFSGRVLNIYVPTFEIQVQDVLRMPSCPACGAVARGRWEELNVSSRVVVDRVISRILRDQEPQAR